MATLCKFERNQRYVSYDNGVTWNPMDEYMMGDLIEYDSADCGGGSNTYRWVESGTICVGDDLYTRYIHQVSYDNGVHWYNVYPTEYDKGTLIEANSKECDNAYEGHYVIEDGIVRPINNPDPLYIEKCASVSDGELETGHYFGSIHHGNEIGSIILSANYYLTSATISDCITSIGDNAFTHEEKIERFTYKGTPQIKSIGYSAFSGCYRLIEAPLTNSIESIGEYAFSSTDLRSVVIPSSVVYLGEHAFRNCYKLSDATVLYSEIPDFTFYQCKSLTSCTLGSGVTSIGNNAFGHCSGLTSMVIPNGVTSIGESAFFACARLKNINMPDSLRSIGGGAFYGCSSIGSGITIPSGVTSIGSNAFGSCTSLKNVTVLAIVPPQGGSTMFDNTVTKIYVPCASLLNYYKSDGWKDYKNIIEGIQPCDGIPALLTVTYSNGSKDYIGCNESVVDGMVYIDNVRSLNYRNFVSAVVGECATSIGGQAFSGCSGLTTITIPNSIVRIYNNAFSRCYSLTSITTPSSVTSIGDSAFEYCEDLISATIKSGSIGDYAFKGCFSLTNCNIGSGVTSIGEWAFSGCSLTACTIEENSQLSVIGEYAFADCQKLKSISLPNTVTRIGDCAFFWCRGMTSATIESGTIGNHTFQNCNSLSSLTIGSGVTSIGSYAFNNCDALTSVTIPNSVRSIGYDAFGYSNGLSYVKIGNGVISIGEIAFEGCSKLSVVSIDAVTPPSLGNNAFAATNKNLKIYVPCDSYGAYISASGWSNYADKIVCSAVTVTSYFEVSDTSNPTKISNDTTEIIFNEIDGVFQVPAETAHTFSTTGEHKVVYGLDGSSIGDYTFYNCSGMTSVEIPSGVTNIGNYAFTNCSGLTVIDIKSETPPTLGTDAFDNTNDCPIYVPSGSVDTYKAAWSKYADRIYPYNWLFKLTLNDSSVYELVCNSLGVVTSAKTKTYKSNTVSVEIGSCANSIGDNAFHLFTNLSSCTISNSVTSIGQYAFDSCWSLSSITIPDYVTSIGEYAFMGCDNLSSVTIGSSVRFIGRNAFAQCYSLSSCYIPSGVTYIGAQGFWQCSAMTYVTIPNTVTSIGFACFENCYRLSSVSIPSGVTNIGNHAFTNCSGLTSIFANAVIPPTLGARVFDNTNDCPIYVPCESVMAYKYSWSAYKDRIQKMPDCPEVGEKVRITFGSTEEVLDCNSSSTLTRSEIEILGTPSAVTSVVIGDCVTILGEGLFKDCSRLSSCTIGSAVTRINTSAFTNCTSITSIDIPNSVTTIGSSAFTNCSGATNCTIGSGVTSIGNSAFKDCVSLSGIDVPNSVTTIGSSAFTNCSGATNCTIGSGVTSIGISAFRYCKSLNGLTIYAATPPSLGYSALDNTNNCPIYVPNESVSTYKIAWSNYSSRIQAIPTKLHLTLSNSSEVSLSCDSSSAVTTSDTQSYKTSMVSAVIGSCVVSIGNGAFSSCTNLTSITVNAVTPPTLGSYAFDNTNNCPIYVPCESIDTYKSVWSSYASRIACISKLYLTLKDSSEVSLNCDSSSAITLSDTQDYTYDRRIITAEIGNCVTSIGESAFYGCSAMTSIIISNSVTSIGESAFYYCKQLQTVAIPSNVTNIGRYAFNRCLGLVNITIPSGLTSISDGTFQDCNNLVYATIPSGVTSIGNNAFNSCEALTSVTIPNTVTSIGEGAFNDCRSGLTHVTIPNSVTSIGGSAFKNCYRLDSVDIGSGVTSIGSYAFSNSVRLTSITINATTPPTLGSNAFDYTNNCPICVPSGSVNTYRSASGWSTYASRIIPKESTEKYRLIYDSYPTYSANCDSSLTLTRDDVNYNNHYNRITSAIIGDCITSIGNSAFTNCTSLTSIVIPSGITSIGNSVFYNCTSLTSVTVNATTPPSLGYSAFYNTNNCPIYVPSSSVNTYKSASGWSSYSSRIQAIP